MKVMTFNYHGQIHRVVYIDYCGGLPHAVITDHEGRQYNFDFEPDCKEVEVLMFYNSGFGGSIRKIQAPKWADGHVGEYWLHPDAKFTGKPKNGKRLDKPNRIADEEGSSANPFEMGRQIGGVEYCKICNRYYDEDCCSLHHNFNEQGEIVYPDGSKQD